MGWERDVTRIGRREMLTTFWFRILNRRNHLEDIGVDDRIILKLILGK
jgi:hypothetical protein